MSEPRAHRVFFGLWPDEEATGQLSALAHHLTSCGEGRVTGPAALHVTLAFIGSVTPRQVGELQRIAAGVRAETFDLSLDRLGFWPQRGILWAGCRTSPPPLRRLTDQLLADLCATGFVIDHRSGSARVPHVTLARAARGISLPRLGAPIRWRVSEFSLVESRLDPSAARYESLTSFPLAETDAG